MPILAVLEPMYCSKCGAMISDESSFCTQCGALRHKIDKSAMQSKQLNANQPFPEFEFSVDTQQPMNQQPMNQQPTNGQAWNQQPMNQQLYYNNSQQSSMPWQASAQNGFIPPNTSNEIQIQPKKKNWKPKVFAIGAACVLIGLIIFLVVKLLPNNKDFYSGTIEAFGKNLNSGGFEVAITVDGETAKVLTYIDPEESEMAFLATSPDLTEQIGCYKGSIFEIDGRESIKVADISEEQELCFKYYNKYFKGISGFADIDLEAIFNDILIESGDNISASYLAFFDFNELQEELKKIESKLNDTEYLEKNFDYKVKKSDGEYTHSLTINMYDLVDLIRKEYASELELYGIVSMQDIGDEYTDIEFLIDTTIKDGYLTKLKFTVRDLRENETESLMITFSDFGSKKIDDMLETVQRYYKNMSEEDYSFYNNDDYDDYYIEDNDSYEEDLDTYDYYTEDSGILDDYLFNQIGEESVQDFLDDNYNEEFWK